MFTTHARPCGGTLYTCALSVGAIVWLEWKKRTLRSTQNRSLIKQPAEKPLEVRCLR